jgi:Uma2 family endonuclease
MSPATQPQTTALITADQFLARPDDGKRTELIQGRVVEMPPAGFRHGYVCNRIGRVLGDYVDRHDLGWVLNNDAGVVTARNPDTVRDPDVAYFSFSRVPKGAAPEGYPSVGPELVFEVISPSNRKAEMHEKVTEYFKAGVQVVCVLDPDDGLLAVYPRGEFPRRYTADEEFTLPEVFPDFRVTVRRFLD